VGQDGLRTMGASYQMSARTAAFGPARSGYNTLILLFGWSLFLGKPGCNHPPCQIVRQVQRKR